MGRARQLRGRRDMVGILAYRHARQRRMWGEQTSYLAVVLQEAAELGVGAFLFGPQDVDLPKGRVRAWVRRGGRWHSYRTRLPAIVYDRFFLRREPGAGRHLARYRQLKRSRRLQFLSPDLPDKWVVHKILGRTENFRPHLPRAVLYKSPQQISACLDQWGGAVLKPVRGQKGLGIWFVRPLSRQRIEVAGGTGARRRLGRAQLGQWGAKHLRPGRFMVQEYLDLTDADGRPQDVRVLVQRDQGGQEVVTGMGARRGRAGTLVANLHRGGRGMPVNAAISVVVPPARELAAAAPSATTGNGELTGNEIPLALVASQAFSLLGAALGPWAELAIDLGVDAAGRIWFIEANSRPGRIIFRRIGDFAGRRRAIQLPLLYARYIMTVGTRA